MSGAWTEGPVSPRKITLRLEPSSVMPITETRFRKPMFSSDPLGVRT